MPVDLQEWIETNNKEGAALRIRCGERSNPRTIGIVIVNNALSPDKFPNFDPEFVDSWEEAIDCAHQCLEGAGWGIEPGEECARVHLLGVTGNQIRTWSRTKQVGNPPEGEASVLLAQELIRMAAELRRSFGVVCDSLARTTETMHEATQDAQESYRAEVEALSEAALVSTLAEIEQGQAHPSDPLEQTAAGILQGLAAQFLPTMGNGAIPSPKDFILEQIRNDPDMAKSLVEDPEVVDLFLNSTMNGGGAQPGVVDETPMPMDE